MNDDDDLTGHVWHHPDVLDFKPGLCLVIARDVIHSNLWRILHLESGVMDWTFDTWFIDSKDRLS